MYALLVQVQTAAVNLLSALMSSDANVLVLVSRDGIERLLRASDDCAVSFASVHVAVWTAIRRAVSLPLARQRVLVHQGVLRLLRSMDAYAQVCVAKMPCFFTCCPLHQLWAAVR